MKLYLYKIGTAKIVLTIENVISYTADEVTTADGTVYSQLADDCELSSRPDCSETLRADWRAAQPQSDAERIAELEEALELILSGETGEKEAET